MKKVLAIDLGARRVGLAATDDSGNLALPLGILPEERRVSDRLRRVVRLGEQRGVDGFLVGLPLESNGHEGASALAARDFAVRLAARSQKPVVLLDERLTSVEADELLRAAGTRDTKNHRDAVAALVLLRAWLDGARGETLRAATVPEPTS